jgi:hypothetical protein
MSPDDYDRDLRSMFEKAAGEPCPDTVPVLVMEDSIIYQQCRKDGTYEYWMAFRSKLPKVQGDAQSICIFPASQIIEEANRIVNHLSSHGDTDALREMGITINEAGDDGESSDGHSVH